MTHSYGLNSKTRHTFARKFRQHGQVNMHAYNTVYRVGDLVDIKGNGSIHKGMPHRHYVGKTGKVWNVTPRAVGIEVTKPVGNKILKKRIIVRVEHIAPSNCKAEFNKRVAAYNAAVAAAKKENKPLNSIFSRLFFALCLFAFIVFALLIFPFPPAQRLRSSASPSNPRRLRPSRAASWSSRTLLRSSSTRCIKDLSREL